MPRPPFVTLSASSEAARLAAVERALRESEARYRDVVEAQTELISRLRADGCYLYVNEAYGRFFGQTPAALIGTAWHPVVHPDDLPLIQQKLAELTPAQPVVTVENRVYSGSGELRWLQFINRAFFDADGRLREIQSVGRDVTERKLAELALQETTAALEERVAERTAALNQLAVALTLAEENERRAIARDLHDDLGQLLHVVKLKLDTVVRQNEDDRLRPLLGQLDELVASASARVRSLTGQLSPPVLERLGLASAFYWLASELADAYGLDVQVESRGSGEEMSFLQSAIAFRCVRELLINVARHAGCHTARLSLLTDDAGWRIEVEDAGCGFPDGAQTPVRSGHFGLASIRERITYLHGRMTLDSETGHGTRVTLFIPRTTPEGTA